LATTRERLIADVWDENWFGSTKTLDLHVAEAPARCPAITTIRGHGYRLDLIEQPLETAAICSKLVRRT